jgi:predicted nucleic acid-binding protein
VTAASAVLDASVFVRSTVTGSAEAQTWISGVETGEVTAHVPELLYAELANGMLVYVRTASLSPADAVDALRTIALLPLCAYRLGEIAPGALALAVETGLSAYDACYAVLAHALGIPLVTADRRLADAVPGATLIV